METTFINIYRTKRYNFFKWKEETTLLNKLSMIFLFACLTALGASIKIYLPFTPVPITLQVFFVLLSGIVLGKWMGGLSQIFYVGMGAAGIPWFTAQSALTGITGGYLIGFILAATFIGWALHSRIGTRCFWGITGVMIAAVAIIFTCGSLQLAFILQTNLYQTLSLGVIPFIGKDILTALVVASLGYGIIPKTATIKTLG
jgi:biotin transport system substrate-specific component